MFSWDDTYLVRAARTLAGATTEFSAGGMIVEQRGVLFCTALLGASDGGQMSQEEYAALLRDGHLVATHEWPRAMEVRGPAELWVLRPGYHRRDLLRGELERQGAVKASTWADDDLLLVVATPAATVARDQEAKWAFDAALKCASNEDWQAASTYANLAWLLGTIIDPEHVGLLIAALDRTGRSERARWMEKQVRQHGCILSQCAEMARCRHMNFGVRVETPAVLEPEFLESPGCKRVVLDYFEGPLMELCRRLDVGAPGHGLFVATWVTVGRWHVFATTEPELRAYLRNEIDMRTFVTDWAVKHYLCDFEHPMDGLGARVVATYEVKTADLPPSYLPVPGCMYGAFDDNQVTDDDRAYLVDLLGDLGQDALCAYSDSCCELVGLSRYTARVASTTWEPYRVALDGGPGRCEWCVRRELLSEVFDPTSRLSVAWAVYGAHAVDEPTCREAMALDAAHRYAAEPTCRATMRLDDGRQWTSETTAECWNRTRPPEPSPEISNESCEQRIWDNGDTTDCGERPTVFVKTTLDGSQTGPRGRPLCEKHRRQALANAQQLDDNLLARLDQVRLHRAELNATLPGVGPKVDS